MCSVFAERDAHFVRDVRSASDVCLRHERRNTSHHFAAEPRNIAAAKAATSLAPKAQTSLFNRASARFFFFPKILTVSLFSPILSAETIASPLRRVRVGVTAVASVESCTSPIALAVVFLLSHPVDSQRISYCDEGAIYHAGRQHGISFGASDISFHLPAGHFLPLKD